MAESPWATTLGAAVAWRRARREARGAGVTPEGEIRVRAASTAAITIEDASGKPLRHVPD